MVLLRKQITRMKISRTQQSRLGSVDFSNLAFGKVFSDHMLVAKYKDGAWQEPEIMPYGSIPMSMSLHALHYGQSAFEGMKAYRGLDGQIRLFRPDANHERLNRSAVRLCMPEVPAEVFLGGLEELIRLDAAWIPKEEGMSLYIRPFLFSSSEFIAARPSEEYIFAIICSPVGPYYSGAVKVKIEEEFTRSAGGGIGYTKAAGNYGGAFYPTRKAVQDGYTQIIWTDHKEHKYIEESGTMNVAFRIGNKLITPPLSDRILAGITRDSILKLTRQWGWEVEERPISVDEIVAAYGEGQLKEAFGMGTAAVVSVISHIGYRGNMMELGEQPDSFAQQIKQGLNDIRVGRVEDVFNWMVTVK